MRQSLQPEIAAGRKLVIDGGTGAELQRRGVPMDPVSWYAHAAITHLPELVSVHSDFIDAGARVITANTFATHRYVLRAAGHEEDAARATAASVAAAERARAESGEDVAIAGSMSCMPAGIFTAHYPDDDTARAAYIEHAQALADLNVDLIALEMIQDPQHGRWALEAAMSTGLPVWLGLSCTKAPSGELVCFDRREIRLEVMLESLLDYEPALVSIMHSPVGAVAAAIEAVQRYWSGPVGVYPEIGIFDRAHECRVDRITPAQLAVEARDWFRQGVVVVGGCCGATPAHIRELATAVVDAD